MPEYVRAEQQREYQAIDCSPEMGGMADVVHIPFRHVPTVQEVQRCEYVTGHGDRDQVDIYSHLRFEQDGGKEDGRDRTGSPNRIVAIIILVLDQVTYCGNCQCADIKGNVK